MAIARRPVLVIATRCGRLGNRLALFANISAFAREHDYRVVNFTFHSYAHLFESTWRDVYCRYPSSPRPSRVDRTPGLAWLIRRTRVASHVIRSAGELNERWPWLGRQVLTFREPHGSLVSLEDPQLAARFDQAKLVFLFGWTFRAPSLVQRHAQSLRDFFRIRPVHEQASRQAVDGLRRQAEVIVGVHVRHADYRVWRGGRAYYFTIGQYAQWMRQFKEQFPGREVAFLVCSDEPRRAEEFPGLKVAFAPGIPVQDLYALARCDYIFGPLSSFSQWASFYGNVPLLELRNAGTSLLPAQFRVCFLDEIPM